jgi:hypothetical protein
MISRCLVLLAVSPIVISASPTSTVATATPNQTSHFNFYGPNSRVDLVSGLSFSAITKCLYIYLWL